MTITMAARAATTAAITMTTTAAGATVAAAKRPVEDVKFLATKALVGALSVAAFLGAWVLIAATNAPAGANATPVTPAAATQAAAIVERQVTPVGSPVPSLEPARPAVTKAPAAPPRPAAKAPKSRSSRGS
jgi:hypothetical protein